MIRLFLKIHNELMSHLMSPNLVVQLGLNPFSFTSWLSFYYRRDPHTDDRVVDMNLLSLRLIFSYSDPRRIRHELEHSIYEGMIRRIHKIATSQADFDEKVKKVAIYKPDCDAYDKEVGMTESGYIPKQPEVYEVKSEAELSALLQKLGIPEADAQLAPIKEALKKMEKPPTPPEA
jgi:hypothetical protein